MTQQLPRSSSATAIQRADRDDRQGSVLMALWNLAPWGGHGGVTTSELAAETNLHPRQVAAALRALEARSVVDREPVYPSHEPGAYLTGPAIRVLELALGVDDE